HAQLAPIVTRRPERARDTDPKRAGSPELEALLLRPGQAADDRARVAVLETQRHGHRLPFEVGMRAREREAERRSPREVHDAAARHPAEFALRACLRSVEALELCGLVGQVAIHGESLLEARVPALEQ